MHVRLIGRMPDLCGVSIGRQRNWQVVLMAKICEECGNEYVTIVKASGDVLVHRRFQRDGHEVVPQDPESGRWANPDE